MNSSVRTQKDFSISFPINQVQYINTVSHSDSDLRHGGHINARQVEGSVTLPSRLHLAESVPEPSKAVLLRQRRVVEVLPPRVLERRDGVQARA